MFEQKIEENKKTLDEEPKKENRRKRSIVAKISSKESPIIKRKSEAKIKRKLEENLKSVKKSGPVRKLLGDACYVDCSQKSIKDFWGPK